MVFHGFSSKCICPKCIPVRRSSLGPSLNKTNIFFRWLFTGHLLLLQPAVHVQGAGRGRFPKCLVNVDTRAWFTIPSTGGVDDDDGADDGADDDLTTRAWLPLPSTGRVDDDVENDDWWCHNSRTRAITFPSSYTVSRCLERTTYFCLMSVCLSFCQMRILRITSYLIVSIRFHSWLFSIWALQAPVDIRDISCLGVPFGSIPGDRHTSSQLQNWVTH